jgi:hypothetical protein
MPSRYRDSVSGINGARTKSPRTSTPGRMLLWLALPVLGVLACGLLLAGSVGGLRGDFGVAGTRDEPRVAAAARLSYDLASMDGQAADVLLIGDGTGLSETQSKAYQQFESYQADANRQLELVGSDLDEVPNGQATYLAIENGLSQYTQYVSYALYIDSQTHGQQPGLPPSAALEAYDHASSLMNTDGTGALAQADRLLTAERLAEQAPGDDGAATILHLRIACGLLIAFIVLTLVFAQAKLSQVFRRMVNPLLVLATVISVVFGVLLFSALGSAKSSYDALDLNGPTPVAALWQTRDLAADMNASQSRWLLAAGQHSSAMDTEQQRFSSDESKMTTQPPENAAAEFNAYLADDTHLRSLIGAADPSSAAQMRAAVAYETTTSEPVYTVFDTDLAQAIGLDQQVFVVGTEHGAQNLVTWLWLPWLWTAAMIALVLLGFLPRLREYR